MAQVLFDGRAGGGGVMGQPDVGDGAVVALRAMLVLRAAEECVDEWLWVLLPLYDPPTLTVEGRVLH